MNTWNALYSSMHSEKTEHHVSCAMLSIQDDNDLDGIIYHPVVRKYFLGAP